MADGFIQVPPDSSGKKVDTNERTRFDASVVERQRFEIPAPVTIDGDILRQVLIELRLLTLIMATSFNITDDLNQMRADIASTEDIL